VETVTPPSEANHGNGSCSIVNRLNAGIEVSRLEHVFISHWLNTVEHSRSWEADNRSAGQEIPHLLWNQKRTLFEKLIVTQIVNKFSAFHRARRFITALTRARSRSLS
jgi:hypothetical protein